MKRRTYLCGFNCDKTIKKCSQKWERKIATWPPSTLVLCPSQWSITYKSDSTVSNFLRSKAFQLGRECYLDNSARFAVEFTFGRPPPRFRWWAQFLAILQFGGKTWCENPHGHWSFSFYTFSLRVIILSLQKVMFLVVLLTIPTSCFFLTRSSQSESLSTPSASSSSSSSSSMSLPTAPWPAGHAEKHSEI